MANQQDIQALTKKYQEAIASQLALTRVEPQKTYSRVYEVFRQETLARHLTAYEKFCKFFGKFNIRIPSQEQELQEAITITHLQITPKDVTSLAIILPILFIVFGMFVSIWFDLMFYVFFTLFAGIALMFVLLKIPHYLANQWRMNASNQMVLCIFYVVTYMRHTSNLERALQFAAEYLTPPLSLDIKKILWDVEIQRYDTVKESLEFYLETWRKWNGEFIEAFHLIESSLYEASEERRLQILDKALEVILEGTKEKMLHYVQNLKSPITTLHMLGVILPILGLVILPLIVNFSQNVYWWHLATVYNIILPVMVYFLGKNILVTRPTGYGDTDISDINPAFKKYRNIVLTLGKHDFAFHPIIITSILGSLSFLIALSPLILHALDASDFEVMTGFMFLGYRESIKQTNVIVGPYGLGASILSVFFPLTCVFSIGLYYHLRSKNVIQIRERTKKLEEEFASALFQLGNRLGDGLPAEIAFPKVAEVTKNTVSGYFFQLVSSKLAVGVGLEDAVTEALKTFPSNVIRSSMKVLMESIKKGPAIASQALITVSRYIKEIHQVNERLKDLLADIISDMQAQITFLTPVIAGIVIGITSMITFILSALAGNISTLGESGDAGAISDVAGFFGDGIPTYFFQIVVGVYVFQLAYILTIISNGIENGADKLQERYLLGRNTIKSTVLYSILAVTVIILFNFIAIKVTDVAGVFAK